MNEVRIIILRNRLTVIRDNMKRITEKKNLKETLIENMIELQWIQDSVQGLLEFIEDD